MTPDIEGDTRRNIGSLPAVIPSLMAQPARLQRRQGRGPAATPQGDPARRLRLRLTGPEGNSRI